jgi:hypothetical protein
MAEQYPKFIPLTNPEGETIYASVALLRCVAPHHGERLGGPYGRCRSVLLYGDGEDRGSVYVRETVEEVMRFLGWNMRSGWSEPLR